jgi:predicted metalloprotease
MLCAVVLVGGCGSSTRSDDPTASSGKTTPAIHSADLARLPPAPGPSGDPPSSRGQGREAFLRAVFDDAQALWRAEFREIGRPYQPARLTIFTRQVQTACGTQPANVGPFYCPPSFGVYLDPAFFAALSRKVGVRLGDFAQAYVVAHEMGHHVQTLLGLTAQRAGADRQDPAGANARSVRFELQADCFAGVWLHSVYHRGEITEDDIAEALDAAAVVGDDFLQNAGRRRPPETWTHGSSAQRRNWLATGFEQGRPGACDTFGA